MSEITLRKLEFCGKNADNGKWVYGDLIHEPWGTIIQDNENNKIAVDPTTVG